MLKVKLVDLAAKFIVNKWELRNLMEPPELGDIRIRIEHLTGYMQRLFERTSSSLVAFIVALIFIHRLRLFHPRASGEPGCSLRLFHVALMIAIKYYDCF